MSEEVRALYHYGGNDFLVALLESKELWLSDLSLSNDTMEGRWLGHLFLEYCIGQGLVQSAIEQLVPHVDFMRKLLGVVGFCLSEEGDLLSQWRGYAKGGTGVAVGFDKAYLEALCEQVSDDSYALGLQRIEYCEEKQIEAIAEQAQKSLCMFVRVHLIRPAY